ncbi:MAG: hypothetical protein ACE5IQ_01645 [Candidatus Methylomirabilales bacterium]
MARQIEDGPRSRHLARRKRTGPSIATGVAVLYFALVPLMVGTPGAAQEVREGQGILERLVFLPDRNQFEITLRETQGRRTFTADNRVVLIKLDSMLLKDPRTAPLARHGPVVFYYEEQQPRIKKPFLSRVVVLFADVLQLKAFLNTP